LVLPMLQIKRSHSYQISGRGYTTGIPIAMAWYVNG
jgi:hypothetical protein